MIPVFFWAQTLIMFKLHNGRANRSFGLHASPFRRFLETSTANPRVQIFLFLQILLSNFSISLAFLVQISHWSWALGFFALLHSSLINASFLASHKSSVRQIMQKLLLDSFSTIFANFFWYNDLKWITGLRIWIKRTSNWWVRDYWCS